PGLAGPSWLTRERPAVANRRRGGSRRTSRRTAGGRGEWAQISDGRAAGGVGGFPGARWPRRCRATDIGGAGERRLAHSGELSVHCRLVRELPGGSPPVAEAPRDDPPVLVRLGQLIAVTAAA